MEVDGRAIFVRMEENSRCLLIGEHSNKRNISVSIPPAGIDEFKKLLSELIELARQPQVKKQLQESTLYSANLPGDPKSIQFMLKENQRGRFVRIVEGDGVRFTSIMIPARQLEEFRKTLDQAIKISNQTPPTVR